MSKLMTAGLLASALLATAAAPARADVTEYLDRQAFVAAAGSTTAYNFQGSFRTLAQPYAYGPAAFTNTGYLYIYDDNAYGAGTKYLATDKNLPNDLTVSLAAGITAVAFQIGTYFGGSTVNVLVDGTALAPVSTAAGNPTTTFVGFVSDSPISQVVLRNATVFGTSSETDIIGFEVALNALATAVPEPASLALLVSGLVAAGAARRRLGGNA